MRSEWPIDDPVLPYPLAFILGGLVGAAVFAAGVLVGRGLP
jgi:hypothetical protein